VSEQTAQVVDSEVKRVIEEAYQRAKNTLIENIDLLHQVAAALLERETLTREDIGILTKGGTLPPRVSGAAPGGSPQPAPTPALEPRRTPPFLGGPEPSPA
jgi:cell division protease FtsH